MSFVNTLITSSALATLLIVSAPIAHAMEKDDEGASKASKQSVAVFKAIAEEKIQFELNSTNGSGRAKGQAEKIETIENAIKVTTKKDTTSYLLESKRFPVKEGQTIKIPYEINVEVGGNITLGLLNTKMNGWLLNKQFPLTEGLQKGTFVVSVPKDETVASLVIRNAQKNPAQTIFTIKNIEILKGELSPSAVVVPDPKLEPKVDIPPSIKSIPALQKNILQPKSEVLSPDLGPNFGSGRAKNMAEKIERDEKTKAITVTTKKDTTSYLLESNRFPVKGEEKILIYYDIEVEANGRISLGLLRTDMKGWYGKELFLEAGNKAHTFTETYEQVVPRGESLVSLVFRNAQKNPAQTTFTIKDIRIQKEEASPSPIVVPDPKLEPKLDILSSTDILTPQKSILQPKREVISPDLDPNFGSGRAKNMAEKIEKIGNTIKVTTKKDTTSYLLESNKFPVKEGEKILIHYNIEVEANGRLSLGLLRTDMKGWYGKELFLEAGNKAHTFTETYEQVVPRGESLVSLVFRNAQKAAAQTIFTIKNIEILKEQAGEPTDSSYLPIVIKEPKDTKESQLTSSLPTRFPSIFNEADLLKNPEKAKQLYQDLFRSSFPTNDEEKKTALTHLLTALHVQNELAAGQPCFSLINPLQDTTQLAKTTHNIIITDKQLADPNIKEKLKNIFQTKAHTLILSVEDGGFVKDNILRLRKNNFLSFVRKLWVVDPKGVVRAIADHFLEGCTELTEVHLPFTHLTEIGCNFLNSCTGLREAHMLFTNLKVIGEFFLSYCTGLREVHMPFSNLGHIEGSFLYGCTGLTKVDMPFPKLGMIESCFLEGCSRLTEVQMPFTNLTTIGSNFLRDCTGLTEVQMPFIDLVIIGKNFLYNCTGLTEVRMPTNLSIIGEGFLDSCTRLTEVHVPFINLTTLGDKFFQQCNKLGTIVTTSEAAQLFVGRLGNQVNAREEKDGKVYLTLNPSRI